MTILSAALAASLTVSGCASYDGTPYCNERSFPSESLTHITISYDEENICFFPSEDGFLTVKEYMSADKPSYRCKTALNGSSLTLSEGGKPFFRGGFIRRVEIYLPATYRNGLTVTSTSGDLDFTRLPLSLVTLRIDNTSGNTALGKADAETIVIHTTRGTVTADGLAGDVKYTSTHGSLKIERAEGSGNYRTENDGAIDVNYTKINGDLSFYSKNGTIGLTLPEGFCFFFRGRTKNGSITTNFAEYLLTDGGTSNGYVGISPQFTVSAETINGSAYIKK